MLDVIDNYLATREDTDFSTVPGRDIEAFGERVREFAVSHTPTIQQDAHPIYLGGWPSANFALLGGDLIFSSLLYSGQVLVRDPIADWFSGEQYRIEHMIAARRGYRPPDDDAETRTRRTRAFLCTVIPALVRMRPLIEAGIIVPVASEPLYFERRAAIDQLRREIRARVLQDPLHYASRFGAAEIAAEDNVRGYFALAPGANHGPGIERAIDHGIRYFSREYTLANAYGVTYSAPFDHERFLCREGITPIVGSSTRVVESVLRSGLPIFHGLSPRLIRDIHDDDSFAEFRSTLHEVYQATPVEDATQAEAYLRDQENALLRPLIAEAERGASEGLLNRLGASLTGNKYGIAAALAADVVFGTVGAATALTVAGTFLDDLPGRRKGPQRIWSSLVAHDRTAANELDGVTRMPASNAGRDKAAAAEGDAATVSPWGVPSQEAMSISVTAGELIWDADPRTLVEPEIDEQARSRLGVYGPCRCGSGRKNRFCCAGLQ
ncbi:hypothetical protein [Arthrobacter bussei]|uniref:SEC-C domain-containing protein n=1 Tax=Arthrobacter bussei TaxID=2594179 RepID=A0A7X1NSH7_9MICC|nr:hypothetical protein [Arthrobacter bussei]MPY12224.1 hypothetical protein [Arthrobacter bussei]